jgi:hypothetical protein
MPRVVEGVIEMGNCYEASGDYVMSCKDSFQAVLVHAEVKHPRTKKYHGHAWVEMGDICLDVANNKDIALRRSQYYILGEVRNVKRFTKSEAMLNMLSSGHYGPWNEENDQ